MTFDEFAVLHEFYREQITTRIQFQIITHYLTEGEPQS